MKALSECAYASSYNENSEQGSHANLVPAIVFISSGRAVHAHIARPAKERTSVAAAVMERAAPTIPRHKVETAVKEAKEMVKVINRAERREAPKVRHIIKEPKAIFHFDEATQTFWVVKPDRVQVMEVQGGRFISVDDTKSGRYRHHFASLVPLMMGLVVRRSKAWEKWWGITFDGNVRTRLVYLRSPDGQRLRSPEYVLDTLKPGLTSLQKERLTGLEGFVKEIDAAWERGFFRVQSGHHCPDCDYRTDCKVGQQWLALQAAETA